ncbi:hypothetical protein GPJ56_000906 [Histomonas meleagridis]|uniref:uncharacterized protein n=1 Tax=Histomonas meleagridis TaxID=135588 RepID=UPI003559970E|nr:hypothetical protein GPJ56_000906 [Histomonas meleagridis]KAH0801264.1 hypothetical protein GO595_005859 [Histomonas meleagridis]
MNDGFTFEGLMNRKKMGVERMKKHNYQEAVKDFKMVTDNLFVDNDKKAAIKMNCFNLASQCYIEIGELDKASKASIEAITVFDMMRPREFEKTQHKRKDILYPHFSNAFIRQGQIKEKQGDIMEAISYYNKAILINPKGLGSQFIDECLLNNYGIPKINKNDEKLKPFSDLCNNLFDQKELTPTFHEILKLLNGGTITRETLTYLDQAGIPELLLGILQLHLTSESVVDIMLAIISFFVRNGYKDAWRNVQGIDKALLEYKDNVTIIEDIVGIVYFCPKELYSHFAKSELLEAFIDCFNLELSEEEFDKLFLIIFRVVTNKNGTIEILEKRNILNLILKYKTTNSFNLLTKLTFSEKIVLEIRNGEAMNWVFEMLKTNKTNHLILNICFIIMTKIFQCTTEEGNTPEKKKFALDCIENIMPIAIANNKKIEVIRDIYWILIEAIPYTTEAIQKLKIIQFTTLMITTHNNDPDDINMFLKYLYMCAKNGLVNQLKENHSVLPTVMKLVDKYSKYRQIIEKVVALAVMLEHPKKEELLQAALIQFPNSKVLKEYVGILEFAIKNINK